MTFTILLLRHGKTPGNEKKRYMGCRSDESLSEAGAAAVKEKQCLVAELFAENVPLCFVSPLRRCKESAALLGFSHPRVIPELTEIDFGDFEGGTYEELKDLPSYRDWIRVGGLLAPPGGEDRLSFQTRTLEGFEKLLRELEKEGAGEALAVCHGGSLMVILSALTGEEYYDFQVAPGEGYLVTLEREHERINAVSYRRV